jgi:hypothetical protein
MPVAGPILIEVCTDRIQTASLENKSASPFDLALSWKEIDFTEDFSTTDFGTDFDGDGLSGHAIDQQVRSSVPVLPPSATATGPVPLELLENVEEIATHQLFLSDAPKEQHMNDLSDSAIGRRDVAGSPQAETLRYSSPGCGVDVSAECSDSHLPPPEMEDSLNKSLITSREENAKRSGPDAGDWVCSLAGLNSELFNHRKSMSESISSFRSSVTSSSPRPYWNPGLESTNQWMSRMEGYKASRFCPIDETFCLALKLIRLLDQLYVPLARHRSPSEPSPPDLWYCHSPQQYFMSTTCDILEDQANRLLLLSCYTRLLNIFCEFFGCLQSLLSDRRAVQTSMEMSSFLTSILPCIKVGFFSVETIPKLQAIMVVDFAESLVNDIYRKFESTASACISSNSRNNIIHHYNKTTDDADTATLEAIRSEQTTFCRHIRKFKGTLMQSDLP